MVRGSFETGQLLWRLLSSPHLGRVRYGGEEESLDYKRSYDLTGKKVTKVELEMLAEVVAIANTSGSFIVLGVDEDRCGSAAAHRPNGIPHEQPGGSLSSGGL
jgi:hypothetical protein